MTILSLVPGRSPTSFSGTATSSTSAYLTWNPPNYKEQNGIVIEYVINMTVLETGERFRLTSNATFLEVPTLRPYRTYVCIIAAATSIGLGPFSESVTVETPEDGKIVKGVHFEDTYTDCQCCNFPFEQFLMELLWILRAMQYPLLPSI